MVNLPVSVPVNGIIQFPDTFTALGLLVSITANDYIPWRRVGYLKIEPFINGRFVPNKYEPIRFGDNAIVFSFKQYRLTFEPVEQLSALYSPIITLADISDHMFLTNPASSLPTIGDEILTTVNPALPTATPPTFTISTAKARKSIVIENATNKDLYIKLGNPTAGGNLVALAPYAKIPANGQGTIMDFSGEVTGIMAGAFINNSKIYVRELPIVG